MKNIMPMDFKGWQRFFYDMFSLLIVISIIGAVSTWVVVSSSNAPATAGLPELMDYIYTYEYHLIVYNSIFLTIVAIIFHFVLPTMNRQTVGMK
ncbi:MAG: hypothetical protein LRY73_11995 [Bacillus sp. (in: Bacteria)]|nr:hypothetical protein [Bacillus sp. (in: firmicutes)]